MKLIFFDESKPETEFRYHHIGAVCIDEHDLLAVESAINSLALQTFQTSELHRQTEFHAAEIYNRKRNFREWDNFDARATLIWQLAAILSRPEVQLIRIQINCQPLAYTQAPENVAFMYLCERANALVRTQQSQGMLIGDRESDQLAERFSRNLSNYRVNGTHFQHDRPIKNLVDSVHFTHSHLSRFLQLADAYTWILQFQLRHDGTTNNRHRRMLDLIKQVNLLPKKYKIWPGK